MRAYTGYLLDLLGKLHAINAGLIVIQELLD